MSTLLEHNVVREWDEGGCGSIMGFDIHGHVDFADVEFFLANLPYNYDEDGEGCFEVAHVWRWQVPREDGCVCTYTNHAARGATPVTQLLRPHSWDMFCLNHPFEPAVIGTPACTMVDGEQIVAEELEAQASRLDPRPVVTALNGGSIFMCRDCWTSFEKRQRAARHAALVDAGLATAS